MWPAFGHDLFFSVLHSSLPSSVSLLFLSSCLSLSSCLPPYPDSPNQIPTEPPAVSLVANTNEWQGSVWSRGRMKGGSRQRGVQETSERRQISASYCLRPCSQGSGFVTLCLRKLVAKNFGFHLLSSFLPCLQFSFRLDLSSHRYHAAEISYLQRGGGTEMKLYSKIHRITDTKYPIVFYKHFLKYSQKECIGAQS